MSKIYETSEDAERVILVGVAVSDPDEGERSLMELKDLADTAGAVTVGRILQKLDRPNAATYVGKGKIEEIAALASDTQATGIICDDELTPAQMRNLSDALSLKVMDRTMLILDIFAKHASSGEGKLQVELAQLKYRSSRLVGANSSMSRVTYGIGMRGPGEKKLEVDRRLIRNRIAELKCEIDDLDRMRETTRQQRLKSAIPVISIVGYTNAGKSTLLNRLTKAGILEADMLFATLDPTTRNYRFESGQEVLFTDTVGFIRKLPHHLVDAFRSTLEEAKYADIIWHVIDAADTECDVKMHVVYDTLRKLGIQDKPVIAVFNKQDAVLWQEPLCDTLADASVKISARNGFGIDSLLKVTEELLKKQKIYYEGIISYNDASILQQIRKNGQLVSESYEPGGIAVKAYLTPELFGRLGGNR